jgi:hypothetical protein
MNNDFFIKKYGMNDFFTSIFSMLKYVWKDALVLSLIFLIPTSILFSFGFTKFIGILMVSFDRMKDIREFNGSPDLMFQFIRNMIIGYLYFFGAMLLNSIARLFVNGFVSLKSYRIAIGENIYFNENFMVTLTRKFPKIFLQAILIGLIFLGIFVGFYLIVFVPILIAGIFKNTVLIVILVILDVILVCGFVVFIVWFSIKFSFSQYPIICEDSKIIEGIKKSFYLVKGNFWRVLGITLLISLILSFALNMVTSPIIMVNFMPSYFDFLKNMSDNEKYMESIMNLYKSMANIGPGLGISMVISGVVESLIMPVYFCLFYIDLKVRKNELNPVDQITNG